MELHMSGQDYVVIFDHHEDVSVLDAEDNPTSLKGYQVKTKEPGNFTLNALLKREPGAGEPPNQLPSILGKLYDLKIRFPQEVRRLAVISNAFFSLRMQSDGKKHTDSNLTKFADLYEDDRKLVEDSLKEEHGIEGSPELDGILEFERSDIPLRGHETQGKGKLTEFLQKLFPGREFRIVPIFNALTSEISVLNNNHEQNASFEDFLRRKALSRRRFEEVLQEAGVSAAQVDLQEVIQRLNSEDCPFSVVADMRREWDGVQLDRLEKRDIPHLRLREWVKVAIARYPTQPRLTDLIDQCYEDVAPNLKTQWDFSPAYVKTYIAVEAYER